jgi:hypothetical protein
MASLSVCFLDTYMAHSEYHLEKNTAIKWMSLLFGKRRFGVEEGGSRREEGGVFIPLRTPVYLSMICL